ncbi:MAG: restriction endonuclease subunit S [Ruminococcus sp.]|nr:restriction endonuclease subunit S [Ruminococcus sp.]
MPKIYDLINKLCPDGVRYVLFSDVCKYTRGITYNKAQEVKTENSDTWKVLRANNITLSTNTLNFDNVKKVDKSVKVKESQMLRKNDILICAGSGSKEHIGKVAFIHENIDYTFGGFMAVIRCNNTLDSRFLFHYILSSSFKIYLETTLNSTTINNLNAGVISNFKIPVPPLEVQREIVRILDRYSEKVTTLKHELEKELELRKKQYEYYASKMFLDTNADELPMEELAKFAYGYTDTAKDYGDTRFIRITDINEQGYLKQEEIKYISLSEKSKKYILQKGDIIMARTGATYGKTLYFDEDIQAVYASFLIRIIPNERLLSRYYWHFTKTPLYWEQANKFVTTGGQPQFNTPSLKQIKIPVPPIEEQKHIVNILDKFDTLCNDLTNGIPAEISARKKQYEYYRDKLLTFKIKNTEV